VTEPLNGENGLRSVPALFRRNAKNNPSAPAYREKEFGIWQTWTWTDAASEAEALALGLIDLGIKQGDFVAIIGRNRPSLYISMVGIEMAGGVPVPLYQDAVAEEMAYVLGHCGARYVIASDQEQVDKVLEIQSDLPNFEQMIYLDSRGLRKYDHTHLHFYAGILENGRAKSDALAAELKSREDALNYDSTCVMLYTSGTTGRPKGVVLSNRNIIEAARSSSEFDKLGAGENVLA